MSTSWEKFGQRQSDWLEAMYQGIVALIKVARAEGGQPGVSYSDFTERITAIHFDPHSQMLNQLLDDIGAHEATAGRPMLSALVRHKHGDFRPGPGFFDAAVRFRRKEVNEDNDTFWQREFGALQDFWRR